MAPLPHNPACLSTTPLWEANFTLWQPAYNHHVLVMRNSNWSPWDDQLVTHSINHYISSLLLTHTDRVSWMSRHKSWHCSWYNSIVMHSINIDSKNMQMVIKVHGSNTCKSVAGQQHNPILDHEVLWENSKTMWPSGASRGKVIWLPTVGKESGFC